MITCFRHFLKGIIHATCSVCKWKTMKTVSILLLLKLASTFDAAWPNWPCVEDQIEYKSGEDMPTNDPCGYCMCWAGGKYCAEPDCERYLEGYQLEPDFEI